MATLKVKDIEEKLSDAKGYRERELKAATDEMKNYKKKSDESKKNWKKREQVRKMLTTDFVLNFSSLSSQPICYSMNFILGIRNDENGNRRIEEWNNDSNRTNGENY